MIANIRDLTGKPKPLSAQHRALYIRRGSFSHINDQLLAALKRVLPDVAFDSIDVAEAMKGDKMSLLRRAIAVQREYGFSSWTSKEKLRYRMARSQAYNDEVRRILKRKMGNGRYDFTLQTQSLYNATLPGIPNFVYTDHVARAGGEDRRTAVGLPSKAWSRCEQELYEDAQHVFTFGPSVRDLLTTEYGIAANKSSAIGAGASVVPKRAVDTSLPRYAKRNIVFVGIDWDRKGGPELVAAFQALRKRMPDATLTIIGCNPTISNTDGIEILGRRTLVELEDHFHAASCFCMPSRLEPFGIVFVEAMQFGLPVVATDVGDIGAIVQQGQTGRLAKQGDIPALTEALYQTLENAETCQAMGQKGLARATNFTWDAVARQIAAHFPAHVSSETFKMDPVF